jgi:hypothetical protein
LKLLTVPFNIPGPSKIAELEGFNESEYDRKNQSIYPSYETPLKREEHKSLAAVLVLAGISLLLELIPCAFGRFNFMDIISAIAVLSMFALRLFDKLWVRTCIVFLVTTLVLDVIWLIIMEKVVCSLCRSTSHLYC